MSRIYSIFHMNLAYSSIDDSDWGRVIERCYWPILELAETYRIPVGLEMTGWTLERIRSTDPGFVDRLKSLIGSGYCELVGSGYAQIIAPLVPAIVNYKNFSLGNAVYKDILSTMPKVFLVNEQAFSKGLISLYSDIGVDGIVIEWENVKRFNHNLRDDFIFRSHMIHDDYGNSVRCLFNSTYLFQSFQRFVHYQKSLDSYLAILEKARQNCGNGVIPLYIGDAEVFDFRPGRYSTEAQISNQGEWNRVRELYSNLHSDNNYSFCSPSSALLADVAEDPINIMSLESPIKVKKQHKYNITRWAVSGRDDLYANTMCFRRLTALQKSDSEPTSYDWENILANWSSDYRTHITTNRWSRFLSNWENFETGLDDPAVSYAPMRASKKPAECRNKNFMVENCGGFLTVTSPRISLKLNLRRGLAIDSFVDHEVSSLPLVSTLEFGFFDDIDLLADFYSGHLVMSPAGRPKVTDLTDVSELCIYESTQDGIVIYGEALTSIGRVKKKIAVSDADRSCTISYAINFDSEKGSLRLGFLTLNPDAFLLEKLMLHTHNGGYEMEEFKVDEDVFDHGAPVSSLVTATCGLGMTEGRILISDQERQLVVDVDRTLSYPIAMSSLARSTKGSYLFRLYFSLMELDDTSRGRLTNPIEFSYRFSANRVIPKA